MREMEEARWHAQSRITSSHCNNLPLKSRSLGVCIIFNGNTSIPYYFPNFSVSYSFKASCINVFIRRSYYCSVQ